MDQSISLQCTFSFNSCCWINKTRGPAISLQISMTFLCITANYNCHLTKPTENLSLIQTQSLFLMDNWYCFWILYSTCCLLPDIWPGSSVSMYPFSPCGFQEAHKPPETEWRKWQQQGWQQKPQTQFYQLLKGYTTKNHCSSGMQIRFQDYVLQKESAN